MPASARVALAGTTSGADSAAYSKVGVWGQTDDVAANGSAGVIGRAGSDGGRGVVGVANGGAGEGVYGFSNTGYGVKGDSTSGIALTAAGSGRLLQTLRSAPPLSGSFLAGEQIRDTSGDLWLCVTGGSPGTWRRVATVKDGFTGGSVNVLAKPIRLFDSRLAAPLPPGGGFDVQVTGIVVGGVSVPAGALALLGNVTVTQTQGPNGYLTLYPQGSPPSPATANINWFAANQDLNTSVVAALNPANGKLTIRNGLAGGSAPTHVVLDAAAFVV